MKIALFFSVVALVVGQPVVFQQPAPLPLGACRLLSAPGFDLQCCRPDLFGGCDVEPARFFPPGAPVPANFVPPPGYLPSPQFLRAVCCPAGTECCPREQGAIFPIYECCDVEGGERCLINETLGEGTCSDEAAGEGVVEGITTPSDALDPEGRCPDGTLPFLEGPARPFRCTLNRFLPGGQCPPNHNCVKDTTDNVNSGVCCRDTECDQFDTCESCASADINATIGRIGCSWLSQGDLYNPQPRCVANCQNFPSQSCIVGGLPEELAQSRCPRTEANPNGTNYNTGSCNRRCGKVGTGRSSRITNGTVINNTTNANPCCLAFPGDYCCDFYGQLSPNCAFGRVLGGPICGVPIRGTVNRLPPGFFGTPFVPTPFGVNPFFARADEIAEAVDEDSPDYARAMADEADNSRQFYFYRPPVPPGGFFRPPPPPPPINRYQPPPVDQVPSQFICSCDAECETKYFDCCDDYQTFCPNATATA